jgi:class 3 adenylate cyclase
MDLQYDVAEEVRRPLWLAWVALGKGGHALLRGRFEEAKEWTAKGDTLAVRAQDPGAQMISTVQEIIRRELEGSLDGLDRRHRTRLEETSHPFARMELALLHSATGNEVEAREHFDWLVAKDFDRIVTDSAWPVVMSRLATICVHLGDRAQAQSVYENLLPYEDLNLVDASGSAPHGPLSRKLAQLAMLRGRLEEAAAHFEKAAKMAGEMDAKPYLALSQQGFAEMLLQRGEPGDDEKAAELIASALKIAEELGMAGVVERCLAMKLEAQGIDRADAYTSIDAVATTVYEEKPDLQQHAAPDGTVTLLFSDIEGSTAKTEELGDQRWMEVLREHNAIIRDQLAAHDGFEVKSEGDGFMLAFQSARKALQCAVALQRGFEARNKGSGGQGDSVEEIRVRIGLHTGEVIKEGDPDGRVDFFGKHVNLAARIAGQASGGEILASSLLKELTASGGDISFDEGRELELKGLSGTQQVYGVSWS